MFTTGIFFPYIFSPQLVEFTGTESRELAVLCFVLFKHDGQTFTHEMTMYENGYLNIYVFKR